MLVLHLPLTGDIHNQGLLEEETYRAQDLTYSDNGKLGKCLQFNGDPKQILSFVNIPKKKNNFTWACWIKQINRTSTVYQKTTQYVLSAGRDCGAIGFNIRIINGYLNIHLGSGEDTDTTASTTNKSINIQELQLNIWYHICCTVDNESVNVYINGELVKTSLLVDISYRSNSYGYFTIGKMGYNNNNNTSAYFPFNGLIQDVRVYDTAISPRQIKEISKGLVCHYPLGEVDGKIGGRNILRNSKNLASLSLKDTLAKVERTDTNCKLSLASGVASNSWYAIYTDFTIEKNQSYTASIEIETVNLVSGSKGCHFTAAKIPPNSSWNDFAKIDFKTPGKYHYTFNSGDNTSVRIALGVQGDGNSNYVIAKNLKLEKGTSATDWTPAPEDDASFYDNVIYDTSGYCNNGSVTDSTCPTWSSDTPRYKGSYVFNGNNQYLKFQNPITSSSTDFTISCWVKFDDTTGNSTICTMRTAVGNGIALFKIGNKIRFDDNAQFTFSDYTISANAWTHVVVTRLSSCKKLYVNGILKQTVNTVGDMKLISNVGTIGASSQGGDGISNYLNGQLSDFRIYATALDNQTIEELYKVGASLDSSGNLYAYDFNEN